MTPRGYTNIFIFHGVHKCNEHKTVKRGESIKCEWINSTKE